MMHSENSQAGQSRSITATWPRLRQAEPTSSLGLWIFWSTVSFLFLVFFLKASQPIRNESDH